MTVNKNSIDMLPDENSTQSRVFYSETGDPVEFE